MTPEERFKLAFENLNKALDMASQKALIASIEALATACGLTHLEGIPVREFYDRERKRILDERLPHYSDLNPSQLADMKFVLDNQSEELGLEGLWKKFQERG